MAKYKGDFYIIDRDETEFGGELIRVAEFDTWKDAKEAWNQMEPDPASDVTLWLARENKVRPVRGETIAAKPEDHHPMVMFNKLEMKSTDMKKVMKIIQNTTNEKISDIKKVIKKIR